MSSENISPTAHFTGYVWYKNNLGLKNLRTVRGAMFYHLARPVDLLVRLFMNGLSLETYLLQRHLMIDHLLAEKIQKHEINQIVEIAAGFSARGYRFASEFKDIHYIETDLPHMVHMKRKFFEKLPKLKNHELIPVDILKETGETSLREAILPKLKISKSTALITEGLISYFNHDMAMQIITRIAAFLKEFNHGAYFSEIHFTEDNQGGIIDLFKIFIGKFVNSPIEIPFENEIHLLEKISTVNFTKTILHSPVAFQFIPDMPRINRKNVIHILECSI